MEEELANLNLIDEEEDAFHEEATVVDQNYQFSLVGRCLTDSVVHFPSLCNTMVDLWHPNGGICLMTETMAKQVGDILGQFLEYDTSILTMEIKKFMRIQIRLDVIILLKRKKKIQIGKGQTVYTSFHRELNGAGSDNVPMDLVLAEENDPLLSMEGKKR
ncbi:hypothetical protein Godav_022888 [Gossypium davidsonii]|uniref:DUF4283 domain-containing protein n=1 Tax=Gossypium davidsonii TaxID=34287 RepID=A0A7J8SPR7_GOSDV|nr:hypothetical protein [Gossypium davidsonii]